METIKKYKYCALLFILVALLLLTNRVMTSLKESQAPSFRNTTLTTEEQQNISIFKNVKDSVVFISIHQQVIDY